MVLLQPKYSVSGAISSLRTAKCSSSSWRLSSLCVLYISCKSDTQISFSFRTLSNYSLLIIAIVLPAWSVSFWLSTCSCFNIYIYSCPLLLYSIYVPNMIIKNNLRHIYSLPEYYLITPRWNLGQLMSVMSKASEKTITAVHIHYLQTDPAIYNTLSEKSYSVYSQSDTK